jgi:HlyD family secretion protein
VIVSAEVGGKITRLSLEEGDTLSAGKLVATIDAANIALQKEQIEASIGALEEKTMDVRPQIEMLERQISVQESELDNLMRERTRFENLVKADAATPKQLDDINARIDVVKKQIDVTRSQIRVQQSQSGTQNRGILSEQEPLRKKAAQLQDQIDRTQVINPLTGTVLAKYAMAGEVTAPGKALYKIADLGDLNLRAYLDGSQLPQVKLGQQVIVLVDDGQRKYKSYPGVVTWISDKAEFTPKTIQTKDERENLVYACKIRVKNDGYLKIGMYGEVVFK